MLRNILAYVRQPLLPYPILRLTPVLSPTIAAKIEKRVSPCFPSQFIHYLSNAPCGLVFEKKEQEHKVGANKHSAMPA
jgi:hypothetical protein